MSQSKCFSELQTRYYAFRGRRQKATSVILSLLFFGNHSAFKQIQMSSLYYISYVYALSVELLPSCEWTLVLTLSYRVQFIEYIYEINILLFGFRAIHFKDCLSFKLRFFFFNRFYNHSNFMTISRHESRIIHIRKFFEKSQRSNFIV